MYRTPNPATMLFLALCWLCALFSSAAARAEVVAFDQESRTDVLDGRAFGSAGPYEKVTGRLRFALDPSVPANRAIVDLGRAPRNAAGKVEFSADLFILRPKEAGRGNRTVLLEVSNRGGKAMIGFFDRAASSNDPTHAGDFGDGFLLESGYTLVWIGWQFDLPEQPGLVRLYAPDAFAPGAAPVVGPVRVDYVPVRAQAGFPLGDRNHRPYVVDDPQSARHVLTVRDGRSGTRIPIDRTRWHFVSDTPAQAPTRVEVEGGVRPGRIYELVYQARDPVVVGCGLAAVRDAVAWLKHDAEPSRPIERAYAFGISQSGRFLRHFLYQGFNADGSGRRVFDALLVHVAGAGRGSFNHRFAQPSRDAQPYSSFNYPTDLYPFTDLPSPEPAGGPSDGLLARMAESARPKIFYTNTSYEYYGRGASLVHTSPDGEHDAPLPDSTRVYQFAGGMHFPGPFPPAFAPIEFRGRYRLNPNDYRWSMRALLTALDAWARDGTAPPPSRVARIANGTLVTVEALRLPAIPGVERPRGWLVPTRLDFGPRWRDGIIDLEPPRVGPAFVVRVPQVDADGNEIEGIRMPDIAVPLATYTGWNPRDPATGAPGELANYSGAYLAFARSAAEREAGGDPRRAIAERYKGEEDYVERYGAAIDALVEARLLLARDRSALVGHAREAWRAAQEGRREPTDQRQ